MEKLKMNIAIYCRVSTDEQDTSTQERRCIEYCQNKKYSYTLFKDIVSGKQQQRTQLNELLKEIRQGKYDALLVYKLDRLGRSLQHLLQIIDELKSKGVRFISMSEGFDTSTAQGMFFFQVAGAFAEFERNLISERTKERLNYLRSQGLPVGRPKGSKDTRQRKRRWAKKPPSFFE